MNFIPHTDQDREEMMKEIGISDIKELFKDIPLSIILKEKLRLPKGMSEIELRKFMTDLSNKNKVDYSLFLGAGSYNHFNPAIVSHLVYRSEFYTAYTPYQPEISQGALQAIFEYQTMICELTGMDVANASLYDGGSALAEASLMTTRITNRKEILLSESVHPHYKAVVKTYAHANNVKVVEIDFDDGIASIEKLKESINENTAGVLIQNPNFFGCIEDLSEIGSITHDNGALLVNCISEPTSLGILKSPGEFADIVVGEGQSFGNPMSFGGPYLGFMAAKKKYFRQLPGRLVGQTVDTQKERGFVLTIQAREQHIRRETATSNICSNEALCAMAATIYLATVGKKLKDIADLNVQKANYALKKLRESGLSRRFTKPFYNEFVIKCEDSEKLLDKLLESKIIGGLDLSKISPRLNNCVLTCVTEMNTREEIDRFVDVVKTSLI